MLERGEQEVLRADPGSVPRIGAMAGSFEQRGQFS